MSRFQTYAPSYRSNAAEAPIIRKWLFRALILSLLIHAGLFIWFRSTRLERFTPPSERLVPRMFTMKAVQVDPKLLEGDEEPPKAQQPKPPEKKQIDLPQEAPAADKVENETRVSPVAPSEIATPIAIAPDKPRVEPNTVQSLANLKDNAASMLEKDLASFKDQLLKDKVPKSNSQAMIRVSEEALRNGSASSAKADAAGMAEAGNQLDGMLRRGGVQGGEKPLQLPGGALFEFGKADLKPEAREQLGKLGLLIKKSPNVTFRIEGYSDSFGRADYNQALSEARANAVKTWLVQNMDVNPNRIQTVGFGSSRLKVEPVAYNKDDQAAIDREIARQQPNRRVEIVFVPAKVE